MKKYILPIWFKILGQTPRVPTKEVLTRIVEHLLEGKEVVLKVNGVPHRVWKDESGVRVEEIEAEYTF